MALIKCVKCTEQYSDTLSACPHCGFIPRIFVCPECNGLYGDGSAACSSCGYVLPGGGKIPATQEVIGRELEHTITVIKEATTSEQLVKIQEKLKLFSMQEDVSEILAEYEKKLSGILSQEQQEALYAFAVDSFSQKRSNAELQELIGKLEALGEGRKKICHVVPGKIVRTSLPRSSSIVADGKNSERLAGGFGVVLFCFGLQGCDRSD